MASDDDDSYSDSSCSQSSWISGQSKNECEWDELGESRESRLSPKLRIDNDVHYRQVHRRPRLLFRAFRPEHGLLARMFQDTANPITAPPAFGTAEFRKQVLPHLLSDNSYPSPFISLTASVNRALSIIDKAPHTLHLAILDYNVVEECLKHRYGENDEIFLVPEICGLYKFDSLRRIDGSSQLTARRGYTGRDEVCYHTTPSFTLRKLIYLLL